MSRFASLVPTLLALSALVGGVTVVAQEPGGRIAPPPVPPAPGSPSEFATDQPVDPPTVAAPVAAVPVAPAAPAAPMVATPATPTDLAPAPAAPTAAQPPMGATISQMQSDARIIEPERPERVPVYPDDPESAWWEINPHYAFDRAQREQKPLLLLFTGVWNPQAMALSQEVFSTKSFNEYVKENLVICYLSYPRNYTDAPDALRRLKDKFKVKGYPNVLIFNPNGEVERGIRGYRTGRPIDYFNQLVATCTPVLESIKVQKSQLVASGYRDWSNYLGKLIFAKFVQRDATHVILEDASGQRWTVPVNDLAPNDQRLAESFPAVARIAGQ
ncbi:MAG: thioredoxin family protein [Verrucomicrobiales bacterium]|nr:thioredoxin family protein [Verrucomicrobiales bacterium]